MTDKATLSSFVDEVGQADHKDRTVFQYLFFRGAELLGFSYEDIEKIFGYGENSVSKWIQGVDVPHRGVRGSMLKILEEKAAERLEKLDSVSQNQKD